MHIKPMDNSQWPAIQEIYKEAFPKSEQKPFFLLKRPVRSGKAQLWTAEEDGQLLGFLLADIWKDLVLVDYLAVSSRIRSRGTGSYIMEQVCKHFSDKKIVLLIERLDDATDNSSQRIARRKFYLKNGFSSSDLFITGTSGEMEILNYGGRVSQEEYLSLQKYALGSLFFKLSHIRIIHETAS